MSGTIDTNFGTNGTVVGYFSGLNYSLAKSVTMDQDNNIIVAGYDQGGNGQYALAKYDSNGQIINSFGSSGTGTMVAYFSGTDFSQAFSVIIDLDNNIIVAGVDQGGNGQYALAKYDSSGNIINSFGRSGTGTVVSSFSGTDPSQAYSVKIDKENNIIIAGTVTIGITDYYALAKYDSNGQIITSFGSSGTGTVVSSFSGTDFSQAFSVTMDQYNNIIIAGFNAVGGVTNYYALAKYDSNGQIISSFGSSGTGTIVSNFSGTDFSQAVSVTIDQDNNIIIAGIDTRGNTDYYALAKYDSSGNIITSFGNNGTIVSTFSGINTSSQANSVAIDQDNNIIIAGTEIDFSIGNSYYALAKYDSNGIIITSFGTNGTVVSNFSGNDYSQSNSVTIDYDNNIIVAGFDGGGNGYYALAKYFNFMNYPCFKENTKILTDQGYKPIQDLQKGDLIKTLLHGFKPINMIGKREIFHQANFEERIKEQLYLCSQNEYPVVFEDLVLTGCHSILVDEFTNEEQKEKVIEVNGNIYITDNKYRLPACVDEKTAVFPIKGTYTIYHLALENDDYYMNYGIYANGLLVESCSKRYLKELSNMVLIE